MHDSCIQVEWCRRGLAFFFNSDNFAAPYGAAFLFIWLSSVKTIGYCGGFIVFSNLIFLSSFYFFTTLLEFFMMENDTDDFTREVIKLVKSYMRRGASAKFSVNEKTGQPYSAMSGEGIIPAELLIILEKMLGEGKPLPPEIVEMFQRFDDLLRAQEAHLSEAELAQLKSFYQGIRNARTRKELAQAEKALFGLSDALQNTIENQRRLRQSLGSKILEAWIEFNQNQENGEGEGDEGDDDEQDNVSDMSESQSGDDGDDGEGDGEGEGGDAYGDTSEAPEDFTKGHDKWMEELERQAREEQQKAEQEQEADAEADAQKGEEEAQQGLGFGEQQAPDGDGAYDLSNLEVDPLHARLVQQAFDKLLRRGRDNPTALPRWNTRKFMKKLLTFKPLRPAKQPTLERKAVLFIIDNSGSMSHMEHQSRALAGALGNSSGVGSADVIVATSFNGNYGSTINKPQDGAWFKNGKYMGKLPIPDKSGDIDPEMHGFCWEWFIQKVLPRKQVNVQLVCYYGDYHGMHKWCLISNRLKQIGHLWFNPTDHDKGGLIVEKNPDITNRENSNVGTKGYVKGDTRYEVFRGMHFLRIDTVEEIATALKRHIGS